MIRNVLVLILLALPLLALPACERSGDPVAPPAGGTETAAPEAGRAAPKALQPSPEHLEAVLDAGDGYVYETAFGGTVDIAQGGVLYGHPASWPSSYVFMMMVPPGAIVPPTPGADRVTITCSVPVGSTVFATPDEDMPLIFEPDGLQFNQPATVVLCYHPNLEASCNGYVFYSIDPEPEGAYSAGEIVVTSLAAQSVQKTLAQPPALDDPNLAMVPDCHLNILATMSHFSRWAIGKGDVEGP